MNRPFLYSANNLMVKREVGFVLDNYLKYVKWRNDKKDVILDIGCGSGDVTVEVFIPRIPQNNFEKLVGIDISKEMIQYARKSHQHPKVFFSELDAETPNIPKEYEETFHHVVSFFCLHWIQNQKQVMKNIFNVLKPEGDMLLSFFSSIPVYNIYELMAKDDRWKSYMQDAKKYISPYQHSKNSQGEVAQLLKEVGFKSYLCKEVERSFVWTSISSYKSLMLAVNPFYDKIPKHLQTAYFDDLLALTKKLNCLETNSCNEDQVQHIYKLLIIYAQKE